MDRRLLRRRLRLILAGGAIVMTLAYLGPRAMRTPPRWEAYRAAAKLEGMEADLEAWLASDAAGQAERLRREGRMSEAERLAKEVQGHRRQEVMHRRNSREFLGRWW